MFVFGKLTQEAAIGISVNWSFGIVSVELGFWYLEYYWSNHND